MTSKKPPQPHGNNSSSIQTVLKTVCRVSVIQRKRKMKGWNQFGVIETIYEEEREFSSTSSPSISPSFSSSPPPIHSRVKAWSLDSGRETDVVIRVQGTCFRLHKDRMVSRSSYLKRHLTEVSDFTLSPPLNITAETFAAVAEFCYSRKVQLTPTNVAAIRTAAELLGMRGQDGENLCHVTESYFRRIVGIDREYASMVLHSCLPLLPDAETTASLVSRCIEALVWEDDDGHNLDVTCLNVVVGMHPQDFQTVADSINIRLPNHDVLYKMVDLYLKENNNGKLTEEQKSQICNCIDCTKLSPRTLVDCVQNPRMPLRFIVRVMLVEHLNTRRSIAVATTGAHELERTSLGEILHRDTASCQTAQLREAMDSTYFRIQSLEKELRCMKKILLDHQAEEEQEQRNVLNSERSASFHFVPVPADNNNSKIGRGGRGSVSSSGFMFNTTTTTKKNEVGRSNLSVGIGSCHDGSETPKMTRTFRHRLITGLRNAFRVSNQRHC